MKKSQELSRKTWKMIAKNLIVLAVLAVAAFIGVMSWFTQHTTATAEGISAKTQVEDGLEYFIVSPNSDTLSNNVSNINTWINTYNTNHKNDTGHVDKAWHEGAVTFDPSDAEFQFLQDLFLCETTSDGITFKIPSLIQYGEIAYVDTSADFEDATANEQYMSFDIYFRSKSQVEVALKSNSSITPKTIDTSTEDGTKNAAIGAVRLSIVNGQNRELLWIPGPRIWYDGKNDDLHTNYTGENNNGTYKPGGNVTVTNDEITLTGDATNEHWYYSDSNPKSRVQDTGSDIVASTSGNYQLGEDDITVVTLNSKIGEYYYNRIRVNLWIEGEDSESRLKFVGGGFDMSLNFDIASGA